MTIALLDESIWNSEIYPVLWLFREVEFTWDSDLIVCKYFIEILFSAI
jgi:hypothetical protein